MKRKLIVITVFLTVSVMSSALAESPPDPRPGATQPVREQNLDGSGYIAVHEQGVADVNVTNSSLQVSGSVDVSGSSVSVDNFPPVQDVNVVGGGVEVSFAPVTTTDTQRVNTGARTAKWFPIDPPILATAVSVSFEGSTEAFTVFGTSVGDGAILPIHNSTGIEQTHMLALTYPVVITGLELECRNESDPCWIAFSVMGYETE